MEKISEPLTGIERMTFHTLDALSSVVRASNQCTEDHRFNTCRGLRLFSLSHALDMLFTSFFNIPVISCQKQSSCLCPSVPEPLGPCHAYSRECRGQIHV